MHIFITYIKTLSKLGLRNCFLIFIYKTFKNLKFYKIRLKLKNCSSPDFLNNLKFQSIRNKNIKKYNYQKCIQKSEKIIKGYFHFYKSIYFKLDNPPNWFLDPYSGLQVSNKILHWADYKHIKDKDIKNIWELSRWEWAPILARAWRYTGNKKYLVCLQSLADNWCKFNKVNSSINWSCAQEASIRLIHTLQALLLIKEDIDIFHDKSLVEFIESHLKRISETHIYAKAQCNNHWISEASALFIGGSIISNNAYSKMGRISLEEGVSKLILKDGTFAQYSINYHRLVLDTLVQVEIWRRNLNLDNFTNNYNKNVRKLLSWLISFVDKKSGEAPNIGANDGAYCYALHDLPFEDFRASIQLGSKVFNKRKYFDNGIWDEPLFFYGLLKNNEKRYQNYQKKIIFYKEGGFLIFKPNKISWGFLRLPNFKYRPSQCDLLHFDLWHKGINILLDGGTYSYNPSFKLNNYFNGIESHNSVQFDNKQPMPKLGKFLFGDWIEMESPLKFKKGYKFSNSSGSYRFDKYRHQRTIQIAIEANEWNISDEVSGFHEKAILRWRLADINWTISDYKLISNLAEIKIEKNQLISRFEIVKGFVSKRYNQIKRIPVLEIEVNQSPFIFKTNIKLK